MLIKAGTQCAPIKYHLACRAADLDGDRADLGTVGEHK
jgi:hypothetical protein